MKYLIYILVVCSLVAGSYNDSEATHRVTVYGDESYIPYSFKQNGTSTGIYVRILEKAFSRMNNYVVNIELIPWKRVMLGLKTGNIFAAFPPYYRPVQRPWIDRYSVPILEENYSVYCRAQVLAAERGIWPEDYAELQIGINAGYMVPNKDKLNIQEAPGNTINVKKILNGRIDCYVNDGKSILYTLKQLKVDRSLIKEGIRISSENGYIAYSAENNPVYKEDFIEKFNEVILEMKKKGEIEAIVHEFIN